MECANIHGHTDCVFRNNHDRQRPNKKTGRIKLSSICINENNALEIVAAGKDPYFVEIMGIRKFLKRSSSFNGAQKATIRIFKNKYAPLPKRIN